MVMGKKIDMEDAYIHISEKLSEVLDSKFSFFHSDLLSRAIFDDNVSLEDFRKGLSDIIINVEGHDDDEFVPQVFKDLE